MDLIELLEKYLRERALADASKFHYRFVVSRFVRDSGVAKVNEVTSEVLLEWREMTMRRNVSMSTWNNYLRHIWVLLGYAYNEQLIAQMPDTMRLAMRVHLSRPKTITLEELKDVMQFMSSKRAKMRPRWFWAVVVRTLYFTGIRRRQLIGLKWRDVDFERATIHLRADSSKNRREWYIPVSKALLPSLLELNEHTRQVLGEHEDLNDRYVFDISLFSKQYRSCMNGRLTARSVSNFFSRLRNGSGVDISAHKLRHTMATHLAGLGLYKELQNLLGHTSMMTTMRYVHPEIETMRAMTERLESIG